MQGVSTADERNQDCERNPIAFRVLRLDSAVELNDAECGLSDGDDDGLPNFDSVDASENVDAVCAEDANEGHVEEIQEAKRNNVDASSLGVEADVVRDIQNGMLRNGGDDGCDDWTERDGNADGSGTIVRC